MSDTIQYFKVKPEREEYLGRRYFRLNYEDSKTVEVCISCGDTKKGKSNTFGIYLITKLTFLSNYFATGYILPCSKKEFDEQFDSTVKMLK